MEAEGRARIYFPECIDLRGVIRVHRSREPGIGRIGLYGDHDRYV